MSDYLIQYKCSKLSMASHIKAVIKKVDLDRELENIECDAELLEKVVGNYIIVKKILSHLSWQDQLLCKLVCKCWRDAVNAQQRACLAPHDFVITQQNAHTLKYVKSGPINTEPMVIFSFVLVSTLGLRAKCKHFSPSICDPPCTDEHDVMDVVDNSINSPKECMLTVKTDYVSYMPTSKSPTFPYMVKRDRHTGIQPFVGGIVIPKIPDVGYHILNIKALDNVCDEFFNPVNKIMETEYIKGILVFVTDKYFLHSIEDVSFLNHFKEIQTDVPYALGGCIIEDTLSNRSDISALIESINDEKAHISDNTISIAMFTLPKIRDEESKAKNKFEMYSVVVESCGMSKVKLVSAIKEFSERVPRFEYSVVLKLSCIGLEPRHNLEQAVFRAFFPQTPLIGCYGNGELGLNHPSRPTPSTPPRGNKRRKTTQQPTIMYSYSTVFVYFGWGKMISK